MKTKNCFLLTDAGPVVGFGHFYRSIAISEVFNVDRLIVWTKKQIDIPYPSVCQYHGKLSWECFRDLVKSDFLILDLPDPNFFRINRGFYLALIWFRTLGKKILIVDGFGEFKFDHYILTLGTVILRPFWGAQPNISGSILVRGFDAIILRAQFYQVRPKVSSKLLSSSVIAVGCCLGGGEIAGKATRQILAAFRNASLFCETELTMKLTVVTNIDYYETVNELPPSPIKNIEISLVRKVKNMAEFLSKQDIVICNTGTIKHEVTHLRIPSIQISIDEFHHRANSEFSTFGFCNYLGVIDEFFEQKLITCLLRLATAPEDRQLMINNCKGVDYRVAAKNLRMVLGQSATD